MGKKTKRMILRPPVSSFSQTAVRATPRTAWICPFQGRGCSNAKIEH